MFSNGLKRRQKTLAAGDLAGFEQGGQAAKKVQKLRRLKRIGEVGSWDLVYDFFGWRDFDNVKQVGAAARLAPTPYDSGNSKREQGISKAGNGRVRKLANQLSWQWLRYQPESQLAQWYRQRFGGGGNNSVAKPYII